MMLITMLLTHSLHALNWQGTGSGMNNTVITEIWTGLTGNLDSASTGLQRTGICKDISDRLNAQWNPAWNVVLLVTGSSYDTILYGYAFRSQWMWYNGVPTTGVNAG